MDEYDPDQDINSKKQPAQYLLFIFSEYVSFKNSQRTKERIKQNEIHLQTTTNTSWKQLRLTVLVKSESYFSLPHLGWCTAGPPPSWRCTAAWRPPGGSLPGQRPAGCPASPWRSRPPRARWRSWAARRRWPGRSLGTRPERRDAVDWWTAVTFDVKLFITSLFHILHF